MNHWKAIQRAFAIQSVFLGEMASEILKCCIDARQGALGPFSPSFDPNVFIGGTLNKILPDDIHIRVKIRKDWL